MGLFFCGGLFVLGFLGGGFAFGLDFGFVALGEERLDQLLCTESRSPNPEMLAILPFINNFALLYQKST